MSNQLINATNLQLADKVIRVTNDGSPDLKLGISTVQQIKDGIITMFRPYTHTSDFSYTGGVICYVGIEEFTISQSDQQKEWILLDRTKLR